MCHIPNSHVNFQSFVLFVGFHVDIKEIENWNVKVQPEELLYERSISKDIIGDSGFKKNGGKCF